MRNFPTLGYFCRSPQNMPCSRETISNVNCEIKGEFTKSSSSFQDYGTELRKAITFSRHSRSIGNPPDQIPTFRISADRDGPTYERRDHAAKRSTDPDRR